MRVINQQDLFWTSQSWSAGSEMDGSLIENSTPCAMELLGPARQTTCLSEKRLQIAQCSQGLPAD